MRHSFGSGLWAGVWQRLVFTLLAVTTATLSFVTPGRTAESTGKPSPALSKLEQTRALSLHDEARKLYLEGRYEEAIRKLKTAIAIDTEGKLLYYNLGLISEKTGELNAALDYYRTLLTLERRPSEQARIVRDIRRVQGAIRQDQGQSESDGSFRRRGDYDQPPPGGSAGGASMWTYVAAATAGACFVAGGILAINALALDPGSEPHSSGSVTVGELESDVRDAHASAVAADVLFIVGLSAAATAVTLALTTGDDDERRGSNASGWRLELAPAQARVAWQF